MLPVVDTDRIQGKLTWFADILPNITERVLIKKSELIVKWYCL